MSKRKLKITTEAIITGEDYNKNLSKKVKLLNDRIANDILDLEENVEVDNHEVSKFLLIFAQLIKTMTSKEDSEQDDSEQDDETDGIVSDTVSIICNLITDLLKNNIDQLSIPAPVKTSLKILKRIFKLIKEKQLKNDAEFSHRTTSTEEREETDETSWEGGEEQRSDSGEE